MTGGQGPGVQSRGRILGRRLAFGAIFVVGLAASSAVVGGRGAHAVPAATTIRPGSQQPCVTYQCVTVTVGVLPANTPSSSDPDADDGPFTGSGVITTDPPGINCVVTAGIPAGVCSATLLMDRGTKLYAFTVTPDVGSVTCLEYCSEGQFTSAPITLKEHIPTSITEDSETDQAFKLATVAMTVTKTGTGTGTIMSLPTGLACGSTCASGFDYGSVFKLKAIPDPGASFTQWTGACAGQGATCSLALKTPGSTNAVFGLASTTTTTAKTTSTASTTTSTATATTTTTPVAPGGVAGAQLIGVKSTASKLGVRIVESELSLPGPVAVKVSLWRRGKPLVAHTFAAVRAGDRVLTLVIPRAVIPGRASLKLTLGDKTGKSRTFSRSVLIGRAGK